MLVEAVSVIVRRDAIEARFNGGWSAFCRAVPIQTPCYGDDLAGVGFMSPHDAPLG